MRPLASVLVLAWVVASGAISGVAAVIHVPADQPTIQAGINAAGDGDTVMLATGIYNESIQLAGAIVLTSSAGAQSTLIDCEGGGRAITATGSVEISGVSIVNGWEVAGGAVYCESGSGLIRDCIFRDNSCHDWGYAPFNDWDYGRGGAIAVMNGDITVIDCLFENNRAVHASAPTTYTRGGALCVENGTAVLVGCKFFNNGSEGGEGGAIYAHAADIRQCTFVGNWANNLGGHAIHLPNGGGLVTNCTFYDNGPFGAGSGGVIMTSHSSAMVSKSLFAFNRAIASDCQFTYSCSNLFGNTQGDWVGCLEVAGLANNNTSADPLFCSPEPLTWLAVQPQSPCSATNSPCDSLIGSENTTCECPCQCHGDPACDSVMADILDVVNTVNVAFRNAPLVTDPSPYCPREATDVDCSGATDVIDVVKTVNVAFRNANPATEFCNPCS